MHLREGLGEPELGLSGVFGAELTLHLGAPEGGAEVGGDAEAEVVAAGPGMFPRARHAQDCHEVDHRRVPPGGPQPSARPLLSDLQGKVVVLPECTKSQACKGFTAFTLRPFGDLQIDPGGFEPSRRYTLNHVPSHGRNVIEANHSIDATFTRFFVVLICFVFT